MLTEWSIVNGVPCVKLQKDEFIQLLLFVITLLTRYICSIEVLFWISEIGQSNGLKHMWKSTNTTIEKEDPCIPSGCLQGQGKKTCELPS